MKATNFAPGEALAGRSLVRLRDGSAAVGTLRGILTSVDDKPTAARTDVGPVLAENHP
jgi:hypothetical protein